MRQKPPPPDATTREKMVAGAARLLAERGLQGASFSELVTATGAPRGSLYHHFPGGKDELVLAALDLVTARMSERMVFADGATALEITERFLQLWRLVLTRSELRAGCAVLAVTVAAEGQLLERAADIFRRWRVQLTRLLVTAGVRTRAATVFSAKLIAASEGAVVLARAEQSLEPFELVAKSLLDEARGL